MTAQPVPIDSREPRTLDLIERIASALPEHVRGDYYREMAHCRVLPECDEMLRILRAMQFLALLIQQAPGEVAAERLQLTRVLEESVEAVSATHGSAMAYLRNLEDRIARMPQDVVAGIQPQKVAELINQDLRVRFGDIPDTVGTLAAIVRQMKGTSIEFRDTAAQLTSSYRGVAETARVAIDQLEASIGKATAASRNATRELTQKFSTVHNWTVVALCVAALSVGMSLGVLIDQRLRPPVPAPAAVSAPVPAAGPAAKKQAAGADR